MAISEYYIDWEIKGEHVLFQVKGIEKLNKKTLKLYLQRNVEKEQNYMRFLIKYIIN